MAVAAGAWYFRAPIGERVAAWWGRAVPELPSTGRPDVGAPTDAAVASLRAKSAELEAGEVDSIFLTPNEVASFVGSGLDWTIRQAFDSLRVELQEDRLILHTRYATRHLPKEAVGVLEGVLRDREPLVLGGRLFLEDAGRVRWLVDEVRLRGVPLPRGVIRAVVGRIANTDGGDSFVIAAPSTVAFVRVSPAGVMLKRMRN